MDMIVPFGSKQERLLDDYSTKQNRPARLPGIVPAEPPVGAAQTTPRLLQQCITAIALAAARALGPGAQSRSAGSLSRPTSATSVRA